MHDQSAMGVGHRPAQAREQGQSRLQIDRYLCAPVAQAHAFHVFHREPGTAPVVDATIQQAGDIRVLQAGQELPLTTELRRHGRAVHAKPDQFQRDLLVEATVDTLGKPDAAHAAFTQFSQYPECANPLWRRRFFIR